MSNIPVPNYTETKKGIQRNTPLNGYRDNPDKEPEKPDSRGSDIYTKVNGDPRSSVHYNVGLPKAKTADELANEYLEKMQAEQEAEDKLREQMLKELGYDAAADLQREKLMKTELDVREGMI